MVSGLTIADEVSLLVDEQVLAGVGLVVVDEVIVVLQNLQAT